MTQMITVTGATGCVGKELVTQLLAQGDSVLAFSSDEAQLRAYLADHGIIADNDALIVVPRNDFDALKAHPVELLINCAFPRSDEGKALAAGMQYAQSLFEAARDARVGGVVNISSQSVYSQTREQEATESEPICPDGKYAVAKYAVEMIADLVLADLPHTNIRLASLFGSTFGQRFVNFFVKQMVANKPIKVRGFEQEYGFLDYRDAALGLAAMVGSDPAAWKPVYNLGPHVGGYTMDRILHTTVDVAKSRGLKPSFSVEYDCPWFNSSLNSELFEHDFNWSSRYTLKDTIEDIFNTTTSAEPTTPALAQKENTERKPKKRFGIFGK